MKRTFCLFTLSVLLIAAAHAAAEWDIPKPEDRSHPGAEAAPASSPKTYPDEKGFQKRAQTIIDAMAKEELGKWRRGYFRGGDPAKYMFGPSMAKLMKNPKAEDAIKMLNDDRTYKEHYHFAAVNWARFLPIFRDALTDETYQKMSDKAKNYTAYHSGSGTENHKIMWYASAAVMPYYVANDGMIGRMNKDAVLKKMKKTLREYVKGLYAAGQGEWDSSTYLAFDINGMLNVYDFSKDAEMRLLAKAALDWYSAGYALKYTNGVFCGPNQRGFAKDSFNKFTDHIGGLWWDQVKISEDKARNARHAFHAITSSYRPNKVLYNIATRNLPKLPAEQINTKPSYWFGWGRKPEPYQFTETVYLSDALTMGSLWNGWGGQITEFMIVARDPASGIIMTGGHPTGGKMHDGKGKYDQSAQADGTYVCLTRIPKEAKMQHTFFSIPDGVKPVKVGDWFAMEVGKAYIAVRPLGKGEIASIPLTDKQKRANEKLAEAGQEPKYKPKPMIKITGRENGFVVQTGPVKDFPTLQAFCANYKDSVEEIDDGVTVTTTAGRKLKAVYQQGKSMAKVHIDGKARPDHIKAVYQGPYVKQSDGVLTVTDGKDGFVVDFTGDLPVYKPMKK
ncbi:MAG: hypothetical protein ACLFVU_12775 [Phycisphaerae bacterium]